ncbi:MAG: hypothetical protein QM682_12470 [Paracoccus sp. (in: a-proteobacteria)]|uniref:hypothetical protein n=1 Tax=Paracoccus sp. TaxID=267 RepID=UPI0039E5A7E0
MLEAEWVLSNAYGHAARDVVAPPRTFGGAGVVVEDVTPVVEAPDRTESGADLASAMHMLKGRIRARARLTDEIRLDSLLVDAIEVMRVLRRASPNGFPPWAMSEKPGSLHGFGTVSSRSDRSSGVRDRRNGTKPAQPYSHCSGR